MDVLSDVLQTISLKGTLFFNADFHEPWCVESPDSSEVARLLLPGASKAAICHLILEGSCWAQLPGEAPMQLHAGDVAILPHGDAHLMGSGHQGAPASLAHVLQAAFPSFGALRYGGDGDRCKIVCGWFSFDRDMLNPLVASLPRLFSAPVLKRPCGPTLRSLISYALTESVTGHDGSSAVAAKAAELLFVEALLSYIASLPQARVGWLAGLRDPQVGRCLALLHEQPARNWTIAELADGVHMSRSSLARHFTDLVGTPPMQYLKRWRLTLAARRLSSKRNNLAQVASSVGYESEAAFNRAFKAEFGQSPGQWRRVGFA